MSHQSMRIWRAPQTIRICAAIAIATAVGALIGLVVVAIIGAGNPVVLLTLGLLAVALAGYLWRFVLYPRIELDSQLRIFNPIGSHTVNLIQITSITPGPDGLQIVTPDGLIEAWCVQKTNSALRSGQSTWADEIATELNNERQRRLRQPSSDQLAAEAAHNQTQPAEATVAEKLTAADLLTESALPNKPQLPTTSEPLNEDDEELIIRRVNRDEAETLIRLATSISTAALTPIFGPSAAAATDLEQQWRACLSDRSIRIRIAEVSDQPIGFVSYDRGSIQRLGVLADHTRRGHGTALLNYALNDLARQGKDRPTISVLEADQPARAFYDSQGWRATGEREISDRAPYPSKIIMVLDRGPAQSTNAPVE